MTEITDQTKNVHGGRKIVFTEEMCDFTLRQSNIRGSLQTNVMETDYLNGEFAILV